jgi:PAS domain S-box-containing protein
MSVVYAWVVLRFHAIDPVAAARTAVLGQMREGLLVVDLQGRIADANPMAAEMLGIAESGLRDKRLEELMPFDPGDSAPSGKPGAGQTEIVLGEENASRRFHLNLTPLRGRHGETIGQLILLHDVTEQRRAQDRILEQKSVVATLQERERLARELHDGIGQVLGYLGMQTQTALKRMHDGDNEEAESLLRRLVEVAKDAHADVRESILSLKTGSGQQWAFIPALKEYVDRFQSNYGIRTDLSLSAGIDENRFDPESGVHLLRAIQEALTNARKHSGAQALTVCLERDGSKAQVCITDDGHGFDVGRLEQGTGDHFGLVFMRERMAQIGGSLKIDSTPGGGTVLTLDVPIGE